MTVLSVRALNRAALHRQLLLRRSQLPVLNAVRQLAGLQAQETNPPYLGLWSRLEVFAKDELTQLMLDRHVVRAWTMRYTLHLLAAEDFLNFRPLLQPVMLRAQKSFCGKATAGMELEEIAAFGRKVLEEQPYTTIELRKLAAVQWPDRDPAALAYSIQYLLPVVHVPPGGTWAKGRGVPSTLGAPWLGAAHPEQPSIEDLIRRYLAAFGPASIMDIQAWCGLTRLKEVVLRMPDLVSFGKLYDLPDAPRPDPDTPAPVRLLPDFDNLMVAYADRTRMMSDEHRKLICKGAGVVRPSLLVDGFVAGAWKLTKTGMVIEPFGKLSKKDRAAAEAEALNLLGFIDWPVQSIEFT